MANGKYQRWIEPEGLMLLEAWARDGLTDEQIAGNMGIATSTLYRWKDGFEEISKKKKKGKEIVDIQVENALLKRALGYEYEETTDEMIGDKVIRRRVTKKTIPPDVTAQIIWLKNRKPQQWRDRPEAGSNKRDEDSGCGVVELPPVVQEDE